MRVVRALLLTTVLLLFAVVPSSAQNDLASVPVPADSHEPATGRVYTPRTPKDISAAFALVDRASRSIDIYEDPKLEYTMKVSFTATGSASYNGSGSMEESKAADRQERWYVPMGDYSMLRILAGRVAYDEKVPGPIPLRIQMLRGALFWPFSNARPRDHVRTSSAEWNGKRVTCVLRSEMTNTVPDPPVGRGWRENEYCIDAKTGLLQIYSEAPGIYVVYDYRNQLNFAARILPRQITIFQAGTKVLEAHINSIEKLDTTAADLFTPTANAVSQGAILSIPLHYHQMPGMLAGITMRAPATKMEAIIVHASLADDGTVLEAESLQDPTSELSRSALDVVKKFHFGRPPMRDLAVRQWEVFAEVDVTAQPVDATPSDINLLLKGGVYDARETGEAARATEGRDVAPLTSPRNGVVRD